MNHIFKKIWNKSLGRMVVVSENAKNSGKKQHTEGGVSEKITQLNSVHTSVGLAVPLSRTLLATTMLLLGLNSSWAVECLSSVPPSSPSLILRILLVVSIIQLLIQVVLQWVQALL